MAGFWVKGTDGSPIHINGDPNMSEGTVQAIVALQEALVKEYNRRRNVFERLWSKGVKVDKRTEEEKERAWRWFDLGIDWHAQVTREAKEPQP